MLFPIIFCIFCIFVKHIKMTFLELKSILFKNINYIATKIYVINSENDAAHL